MPVSLLVLVLVLVVVVVVVVVVDGDDDGGLLLMVHPQRCTFEQAMISRCWCQYFFNVHVCLGK